jgi:hypothetical protein
MGLTILMIVPLDSLFTTLPASGAVAVGLGLLFLLAEWIYYIIINAISKNLGVYKSIHTTLYEFIGAVAGLVKDIVSALTTAALQLRRGSRPGSNMMDQVGSLPPPYWVSNLCCFHHVRVLIQPYSRASLTCH